MFRSSLWHHRDFLERYSSLLSGFQPYPRFFSRQRGHAKAPHVENPPLACLHVLPTSPPSILLSPFDPFSSRRFISSEDARFRAHKSPTSQEQKTPALFYLPPPALRLLRGPHPFFPASSPCVSRFPRLEGTRARGGWKFRTNLHVALLTISFFEAKTQASSHLSIKEMTLNNISSLPCGIYTFNNCRFVTWWIIPVKFHNLNSTICVDSIVKMSAKFISYGQEVKS